MKKLILPIIVFVMLCVACKHQDIAKNQSVTFFDSEVTSGATTEESTLENSQAVADTVLQSGNLSSDEPLCEHTQYTLKENYTDYQEMLKDYGMVTLNHSRHQDSSCKDNQRSSAKLYKDVVKMQEIRNEMEKTCSSKILTDEEKLEKIEFSIESLKDDIA